MIYKQKYSCSKLTKYICSGKLQVDEFDLLSMVFREWT